MLRLVVATVILGAGQLAVAQTTDEAEVVAPATGSEWMPEIKSSGGLVGAIAMGDAPKYGGGAQAEFKLEFLRRFDVGVRAQGLVFGGGTIDQGTDTVEVAMGIIASYSLIGDYFLTDSNVRPFVGLGMGGYTIVGEFGGTGGASIEVSPNAFGIAPRAGIELGGFILSASYHHIFDETEVVVVAAGPVKKISRDFATLDMTFGF